MSFREPTFRAVRIPRLLAVLLSASVASLALAHASVGAGDAMANAGGRVRVQNMPLNGHAPSWFADTLRFDVDAGSEFIATLPDSLDGIPVVDYETLRAPARSLKYGFALFWQTRPQDPRVVTMRFLARLRSGATDTVHVVVSLK